MLHKGLEFVDEPSNCRLFDGAGFLFSMLIQQPTLGLPHIGSGEYQRRQVRHCVCTCACRVCVPVRQTSRSWPANVMDSLRGVRSDLI